MSALRVTSLALAVLGSQVDGQLRGSAVDVFAELRPSTAGEVTGLGAQNATSEPNGYFDATTLHWNSHRPCATDNPACIALARQSLAWMAQKVGAKIVGTVELHHAAKALPGWQSSGEQWDWATILVAPGWKISKSGGWAMGGDKAKGFAVAVVEPPEAVQSCPNLCVFMGHVPHPGNKIDGHGEIDRVCGGLKHGCMIAMADWNRDDIRSPWKTLMHDAPSLVEPHDKTCCYNDGYSNRYDHTSTNIAGSYSAGKTIFDPQLTKFPSWCEHKPTSIQLKLPKGSSAEPERPHGAPLFDAVLV